MFRTIFFFLLIFLNSTASAIDNPDAPDYMSEFLKRVSCYEKKLSQDASITKDYVHLYADYEVFLDKELNRIYALLIEKLDTNSQKALKKSQQQWLIYRDKEFNFIHLNWNKTHFGSSSVISKGSYRTTLIRERIIILLHYLKNY